MIKGDKLDLLLGDVDVLLDVTPERDGGGNSPWVIVRHGRYALALCLMPMNDHLCVDAHAFVDGEAARTGVFGMDRGNRWVLGEAHSEPLPGLSHCWPAAGLVALLVGEQSGLSPSRTD